MADFKLKFLVKDVDRHGNVRLYLRRKGAKKIRLQVDEHHPEMASAYAAALKGEVWHPTLKGAFPQTHQAQKSVPGSFRAVAADYVESAAYKGLSPRTRYVRLRHLNECSAERLGENNEGVVGNAPFAKFRSADILLLRDRKATAPEAANDRLKALKVLFKWAAERGKIEHNCALTVPRIKTGSSGFKAWSPVEIRKFQDRHPIGTKARLAFSLLFYLGQRRSDITRLGHENVFDGALVFTQWKGRGSGNPSHMNLRIADDLKRIMDRSQVGKVTFLETDQGRPFTDAGFGNWFRARCEEAGIHGFSAHGLRKANQRRGAELGITDRQLMALAGHKTAAETTRYTRSVDQKKLSDDGISVWNKNSIENWGDDQPAKDRQAPRPVRSNRSVWRDGTKGVWRAVLTVRGSSLNLGEFASEEAAQAACEQAYGAEIERRKSAKLSHSKKRTGKVGH